MTINRKCDYCGKKLAIVAIYEDGISVECQYYKKTYYFRKIS